jgi:hypothetical protein
MFGEFRVGGVCREQRGWVSLGGGGAIEVLFVSFDVPVSGTAKIALRKFLAKCDLRRANRIRRREGDSNPRSRFLETRHFQCRTIGRSVISPVSGQATTSELQAAAREKRVGRGDVRPLSFPPSSFSLWVRRIFLSCLQLA